MKKNLILINKTDRQIMQDRFFVIYQRILSEENHNPNKIIVNVLFVSDKEMIKYNIQYRKIKGTTDVLSFEDKLDFSPVLGDIIINVEQADRQKESSLINELLVLFIHGLLHLLGYDHISADDAKIMENKENKYRLLIKE